MAVKAQEYDKVDILKQVGEYESKYTLVQEQKEHINKIREQLMEENKQLKDEAKQLNRQIDDCQIEIQALKVNHNQNLDQFDSKFDELHRQLEFLTRENNNLKTREQALKDKMAESEKEKNYWREKCRIAEKKGDEINHKITQLESELRTIIFEKQPQKNVAF